MNLSESMLILLGGLSLVSLTCGGTIPGADARAPTLDSPVVVMAGEALSRHRATSAPASPPAPATNASVNVDEAIAAAQTPDGRAIPQGPGPNGECPTVLVLLGFWSCPQIGDTCASSSNGTNLSCLCQRTDGEGQTPSWICQ